MHRCSASTTTITPRGFSTDSKRVGDLGGQPLLHLRAAGVEVDQPGELGQPGDLAVVVGDVTDVRLAVEADQVVLADGVQRDVLDQHHLVVALVEDGGEHVGGIAARGRRRPRGRPAPPGRGCCGAPRGRGPRRRRAATRGRRARRVPDRSRAGRLSSAGRAPGWRCSSPRSSSRSAVTGRCPEPDRRTARRAKLPGTSWLPLGPPLDVAVRPPLGRRAGDVLRAGQGELGRRQDRRAVGRQPLAGAASTSRGWAASARARRRRAPRLCSTFPCPSNARPGHRARRGTRRGPPRPRRGRPRSGHGPPRRSHWRPPRSSRAGGPCRGRGRPRRSPDRTSARPAGRSCRTA